MTTSDTTAALRQEILDLERKRITAMIERDRPTLDHILSEDLTYTHSGGRSDSKYSFLELISDADNTYLGVDYSNEEVLACGPDGALVRGIAQISLLRNGTEHASYPVWFVNVYARREGRWQMLAWQATRAPEQYARPGR